METVLIVAAIIFEILRVFIALLVAIILVRVIYENNEKDKDNDL